LDQIKGKKVEEQHYSLNPGTILKQYKIIRVLGEGGFGITYLAEDIELGLEVVIKEYFPNEFAMRAGDSTITAKSKSIGDFTKGMQRFKEEAQTLAKFNHPSIVKILGYFEANDTAYFVMEYEEGIDLSHYIKQKGTPFPEEEILSIIMPILEGLKEVHAHNYLHRDIKPGNILLRNNKSPVLIDFGASKLAMGEASKSITSMLTEGYAPLEQYSTDIKQQGPFTDIYAIAAVIYKMITGEVPPSAQTRSFQLLQDGTDPLVPLMQKGLKGYDENFLKAVDRALSMKASQRPQNVQEFQKDIAGEITYVEDKKFSKPTESSETVSKKSKIPLIAGAIILVTTVLVVFFMFGEKNMKQMQSSTQTSNSKITAVSQSNICKENGLEGCYKVAHHYAKNGSIEKAASYFKKACDNKDARGCTALGIYYYAGKGIEKNMLKAKELFEKACREGNGEGCYNLALTYTKDQNYGKAITFYEKACSGGYGKACYKLGSSYLKGDGVEINTKKAKKFYINSCRNNSRKGCTVAGVLFAKEKNFIDAKEYFEYGCKLGSEKSCYNLAILYTKGEGIRKDLEKAKILFDRACKNGYSKSCNK
jgi:serine/threonine protein kinase